MSNVQLTLSDSLRSFLDAEVAAKGYDSASAYITALLCALQQRQAWDNLEPLVLQGLASPAREMRHEDWRALCTRVNDIETRQQA